METCFANKLATGKFAMGSNEALGKPVVVERPGKPIDLDGQETNGEVKVLGQLLLLIWTSKALVQVLLHLLS